MSADVEIGLLGPLQVRCDGVTVAIPAGKQRALLAALLLQAGRRVPADQLAELLWSPPPATAPTALRNYVMRLRHALGPAGRHLILTRPGGYLIREGDCELDLARFEEELAAARRAAGDGDWHRVTVHADAALGWWRGEPLSDVDLPALTAQRVPRLTEMRLQARELRIEADLALARHAEAVTELPHLIAANPVRERLYALLMLAYYRCGRRAEALDTYRSAHDFLAEEVGADPAPELQALHQQILHDDPALTASVPGGLAAPVGQRADRADAVPRQLPAAVPHFAGRAAELEALTGMLDDGAGTGGAVVLSAIGGTAGVGKTALAVQWAHRVTDRFPDGQLYVNLRGYDPGQPVPAADALAGFLRALGVPGQDIPAEADERAARYRSLLAGRRILIVADNAGSAQQVRPLLPGTQGCVVVVTSRDALAGLVARDGARRLELDLLPLADAVSLLRLLIGGRVDADPESARALADQCARLPLALRVAAELATARPDVPLADLVVELADQQRRLDRLDVRGDPVTAVRAVFSWSVRHLDPAAAATFRLSGLHPAPGLDPYAAAVLTGSSLDQAGQVLDQLSSAHLLHATGPGRYSMHDLLRAYARELATARESPAEQRAALTRLFDHYLHATATAADVLYPADRHRRPRIPAPAAPVPPLADPAAARAWLDAERDTLVAVVAHAADSGWPGHATKLAATLYRYLDAGAYYPEAITIHTCARRAARVTGDQAAEADALSGLGIVESRQGHNQQAASYFQQALALFRETGDRAGQARAHTNLGMVDFLLSRYQQAAGHHQQALALFRETGDGDGEACARTNFGIAELHRGRYQQAAFNLRQALALFRQTGDRGREVHALVNLGDVEQRQGHHQQATDHLEEALNLCHETGDRACEVDTLANLGDIELRQGRYEQAASHLEQALNLCHETGERASEAQALNGLGEIFLATGQPGHARTQHAAALALARQTDDQYQQARALHGLGTACHTIGEPGQARSYWQQALTLYTELGTPEADQVRAQLVSCA
jgi:DNA-binding SARP family transcriptional activator/Tfp pilus assembly protein PilF